MNDSSKGRQSKRIFYFDALRALAIISVIMIHIHTSTLSVPLGASSFHTLKWFTSDMMAVWFRIGVDLFLMLSGALSLGRDWTINSFLGKRLPRIVIPFLFWGFVLSTLIAYVVYFFPDVNLLITSSTLGKIGLGPTPSLAAYLNFLYNYYMAKSFSGTQYWFFWMILGTYLIMPVFNKWISNSDLKELEYFLVFWLITCVFNYTLGFPFPIRLTYFVSPIGLVVAGYYLRYTDRKILNNPFFAMLLILFACAIQLYLSYNLSTPENFYTFHRYSIWNTIEVIGVFLLFKNIGKFNIHINFFDNPDGIFRKAVFSIAKYSYGMYLVQTFVIKFSWEVMKIYHINGHGSLDLIVLLIASIFISWAMIALLNLIPGLGKYIGAK